MIKIIYFLPNKGKKTWTLFEQMILPFNAYFVSHIFWFKNGILDFQVFCFGLKHKIYISSKNVLLRICRPHLGE